MLHIKNKQIECNKINDWMNQLLLQRKEWDIQCTICLSDVSYPWVIKTHNLFKSWSNKMLFFASDARYVKLHMSTKTDTERTHPMRKMIQEK